MNDKSYYEALIDRVVKIDKGAAIYMREHAPDLIGFVYDRELVCCFIWECTPQGYDFWKHINDKLNEVM